MTSIVLTQSYSLSIDYLCIESTSADLVTVADCFHLPPWTSQQCAVQNWSKGTFRRQVLGLIGDDLVQRFNATRPNAAKHSQVRIPPSFRCEASPGSVISILAASAPMPVARDRRRMCSKVSHHSCHCCDASIAVSLSGQLQTACVLDVALCT